MQAQFQRDRLSAVCYLSAHCIRYLLSPCALAGPSAFCYLWARDRLNGMGWSLQDPLSPQKTTVGKGLACGSWWGLTRWWRGEKMQWPWNLIGFYGWFSTSLHAHLNILTLLLSSLLWFVPLCLRLTHTLIQYHAPSWYLILYVCPSLLFFSNDTRKDNKIHR